MQQNKMGLNRRPLEKSRKRVIVQCVLTDGFAEMDGVFELLSQNGLAGVPRHFEEEEARVALGKEAIRRVVLVHDLREVGNG